MNWIQKKGPFSSPITPFCKEDMPNHFLTVVPRKHHSGYDSNSYSSSSSNKTIKSSIPDVKSNTINSSSCEKIVLEAKGIPDPTRDSTSVLREEGFVHSTQDGLLLEPTYGGTEYFSKKQEYSGKYDSSLPVSLEKFETLPVDQHVDVRRFVIRTKDAFSILVTDVSN